MIDLTIYTDAELHDLGAAVTHELNLRAAREGAAQRVDNITRDLLRTEGMQPGEAWTEQLLGYPEGWIVTHNGRTYRSLIRSNVWEPGNTADPQYYRWWEDITPEPPLEPGETPEWDGEGHAYTVGDVVTYEGVEYECTQGHTSQPGWTPPAVAALWQPVEGGTS